MYVCIDPEPGVNEKTPILNPFESRRWYRAIPARYAFAILSSFAFFNVYAMRVNLHVTMVAMVSKKFGYDLGDETVACRELMSPVNNSTLLVDGTRQGEFNWDSTTQSNILGSFFIGYVITQIPGGILAERYGAKWLFGIGILITALFTLLTPLAAYHSVEALIAVRILEGLGEGVTYPAMNALIGRWVPKLERSRIATIIYTGSPIGTVVSLALSGYISASDSFGGWPTVFYLFGACGCVWFVFWILLIHESPEVHPRISTEELDYIRAGQDHVTTNVSRPIPWKAILTTRSVWALVVTHFGFNWGFYTLLTELPTYLSNVLHFDLQQNGLLSATPYVCQALFAFLASFIADKLRAKKRCSITRIRKIINSFAFFIPGLLVAIISTVGCHYEVIIVLIVLSVAFSGFMYSGFNVTHVDMSPEFAGTLMGITNCVANMAGFLAPLFAGWAVKSGQSIFNWGFVFFTTSGVYFGTGMIYNLFASAELQPWGEANDSSNPEAPEDKGTPENGDEENKVEGN